MTIHIRNRIVVLTGVAIALTLTACSASSSAPPTAKPSVSKTSSAPSAGNVVVIHMFTFHPSSLTVAPGATITVRNTDSTTHTLTDKANPKLFSTGDIAPGRTKTFTAPAKPGRYPYFCLIHQFMAGTLIVR